MHHFPGLSVIRCQYGLFLSHSQYATDILHHAIRQRATHVAGLLTPRESYVPPLAPLFSILHSIIVLLVHSSTLPLLTLIFLMQYSRYITLRMIRVLFTWSLLKGIFALSQRDTHSGLHIWASSSISFTAYSDADWALCPDTRRSTSDYCVSLGPNLI